MIRRIAWPFWVVVAAGCAQATAPGSPADAPPGKPIDAPEGHPIDAPSTKTFMDAPMMTDVCTTSATCATATVLAGITGDDGGGNTTASASGYQAAWFSIRVSEEDSGVFGYPMSLQTTLTSPSSAMFDLFVYVDTSNDDLDCTSATGTVTTSGSTESSNIEWGETGEFGNNSDDSRTVSIEVRPKAGAMCSSADTWSLTLQGDVD